MDAPDYIIEYVQEARELFGVGGLEWHFFIEMTDKPGGDAENGGFCSVDPVYMNATLEFAESLENSVKTREHVYHEVLHVSHGWIDLVVRNMLQGVPESQREIYEMMYRNEVESFVQRLARCLVASSSK